MSAAQNQPQINAEARLPVAHENLWTELRSLPRGAWVLFLGIFLNRFGTFVIPFLTIYLTRKGYSLADAGTAIGAYGVGTLVASYYGGYLADRIGRRKTIALSMFGGAITMLALSWADARWTIFLMTASNGFAGELYRPASSALLADLVPAARRIIAFSTYRMALNAGWAFGPATAGFLTNKSFTWLFWGDALSSLLFGLLAWTALPHGLRSSAQEAAWKPALALMKKDSALIQFLFASIFIAMVFYQMSSSYGLFITALGYPPSVYGALISFNGAVVVCLELFISNYSRRFNPRSAIALGYLLVGAGFGLNAFATTLPLLVLAMLIFTLGEMISIPTSAAYIANLAPEKMRGRYMGAHGFTWALMLIFAPGAGIFLFSHGSAVLWLGCALSASLGALVIIRRAGEEKNEGGSR